MPRASSNELLVLKAMRGLDRSSSPPSHAPEAFDGISTLDAAGRLVRKARVCEAASGRTLRRACMSIIGRMRVESFLIIRTDDEGVFLIFSLSRQALTRLVGNAV